jgi:hypothetical protein
VPTKTERILALLPRTFEVAAGKSALRAVADAFGTELLQGENSLAEVMRAHWVDHADKGAGEIRDLALFAALYGLSPREDESVEEFREHLKRYVRTFLEGTSTIQGILRVTAEALGLRIEDDNEKLDSWWRRQTDELVTLELRGDDAAELLFGVRSFAVAGAPARPAAWTGTVDLSGGADLREASVLRIAVDGAPAVAVDLGASPAVAVGEIVSKINAALGQEIAREEGSSVSLASPTAGPASRLEVREGDRDAAGIVLGLPARTVRGRDARPARVTGAVDLSGGADLSTERYLRIALNGTLVAEIDAAGPDPAHTTLDQIRDRIDAALGAGVASHDGRFLTLTSPTTGFQSTIAFLEPAAQDARVRLFGPVPSFHLGADAVRARLTGTRDLSGGVDLSERSRLRVRVDDGPPALVDCAGADPMATRLEEIAAALNSVLGAGVASHDGRLLTLTSPTAGAGGSIAVVEAPERDASSDLFGLLPRAFRGSAATRARFTSTRDWGEGEGLWGRYRLTLAVDGGSPVEIELEPEKNPSLDDLAAALEAALGAGVASHDGHRLTLTSPTEGSGSSLVLVPRTEERRRRFVTRAFVTDEASTALLGFVRKEARGEGATAARVVGRPDLSRGVDLRGERFLRLALDGAPGVDVDCAGVRPRATTLAEVVNKINQALGQTVAFADGRHLVLVSPTAGAGSRIVFEPARAADALDVLLGVPPGLTRGRNATTVRFVSTVDLSVGVDLPAGAAVKLAVDAGPAVEVPLAAGGPVHASLSQIVNAVNVAVGGMAVASHDGVRLRLASRQPGEGSRLAFEAPAGTDVTRALFGVEPPRTYQGTAAGPARVVGRELSGPADLSTARFLRLGVDGKPPVDVDCAAGAADPKSVPLGEVVAAINAALPGVASESGGRLVLASPSQGFSSRIAVAPYTSADARKLLFGDVPAETAGTAPARAVITGAADLLKPVDLSRRSLLRVAVDGGPPRDVAVAGSAPKQTLLEEVVAAINAEIPGLASATADDRLRLTSPTAGEGSRLEILPLRALEVQEYPPEPAASARTAVHGDLWAVVHRGAADAPFTLEIRSAGGVLAPGVTGLSLGLEIRVLAALAPGEKVVVRGNPSGALEGEIVGADGAVRPLPASALRLRSAAPGLTLPRGRTEWLYVEGLGSRFDQALFDEARFAGFPCTEVGIFDASRFSPAEPVSPVFAPAPTGPSAEVVLRWSNHRPGAFAVNLPADLPSRFGGRFDEARFGVPAPEEYNGLVTEPEDDPSHFAKVLPREHGTSTLVWAETVDRVPLGFEGARMPFRKPRFLTLGSGEAAARLYLTEPGVPGAVKIEALRKGASGNEISVVTRPAGPGAFDVLVSFAGGRFENARQVALGVPLPALAADLMKPGPIGILQAKAAGVEARVTRDRTESSSPNPDKEKDHV